MAPRMGTLSWVRLRAVLGTALFVLGACSGADSAQLPSTPDAHTPDTIQPDASAPDARVPAQPAGGAGASDAMMPVPTVDASGADAGSVSADAGTVIAEPMDEAAFLYDPAVVHTFDVEIAEADLARIDANPSAEEYVPAQLSFGGAMYEIAFRYKGSIGAFQPPCSTGGFQGGGPKTGKCSVKLAFDQVDPEARFFGLRKIQFHAMNNDPSMLRERLGYGLFREMGVPASRATHAVLRVNGVADIYAFVEVLDGRFTRSRFSEGGEGNLYKEVWPVHDSAAVYLNALETNEDEEPSVDRMLRFKAALAEGADAARAFVDLDVTARYMAVDRVIMNDDGAFHFYCIMGATGNNPTIPGNHNYYWYEAEHADRLWIIPWDLDHSMNDRGQLPHIASDWRSVASPDQCMCQGGFDGPAPGCDRVIQSFQAWQDRYEAQVDGFLAGPFRKELVDAKLDAWKQQIVDAGFSPNDFAIDELKAILDRARENRGYPY